MTAPKIQSPKRPQRPMPSLAFHALPAHAAGAMAPTKAPTKAPSKVPSKAPSKRSAARSPSRVQPRASAATVTISKPPVPHATRRAAPIAANVHWVFVYGTLKRGFANATLLEDATFLGEFRTVTPYPLVVGEFCSLLLPSASVCGLVVAVLLTVCACFSSFWRIVGGAFNSPYLLDIPNSGARVKGEVYAVNDRTLVALDRLENVGVNYSRKVSKVTHCADRAFVADAFVYLKCNFTQELVSKTFLDDYQCRRYIPRHLRPNASAVGVAATDPGSSVYGGNATGRGPSGSKQKPGHSAPAVHTSRK